MNVPERLAQLGIKRMLLAVHDVSFPVDADEDLGRGSPASRAAMRLYSYARGLGFTGIQLGPQGQTPRSNPSPYDGTIFSRNLGNIAPSSYRDGGPFEGLVGNSTLDRLVVDSFGPARHVHAYDASHELLGEAYAALQRGVRPDLRARLAAFRAANASWLEPDALHHALCATRAGAGYRAWAPADRDLWLASDLPRRDALLRKHAEAIDRYAFGQLLVHDEHARVRQRCGLKLYGDLQVGYSDVDSWRFAGVFMRGYRMGAPPSRTNPDGQPWGYPVLDAAQYAGAVRDLIIARTDKAFSEYDSLRIDHPHGIVCPWVYRDGGDPMQQVREGARLFESPDLPDHPELAAFAIARPDQIDRECPRYADRWVRSLEQEQIDRYALLLDAIVDAAERHGRARDDLSCEVLSTMPTPLAYMLKRHGLGRWRVTQKANLDDASDVYRSENVVREDWVMLGNHDTAPILSVIRGWTPAHRDKWARHLTGILRLDAAMQGRLASDGFVATAMLAELFASRAENVQIFFADLFGYTERFNTPGLVDDANWTLRIPAHFERLHAERLAGGEGLDLQLATELALSAPR